MTNKSNAHSNDPSSSRQLVPVTVGKIINARDELTDAALVVYRRVMAQVEMELFGTDASITRDDDDHVWIGLI